MEHLLSAAELLKITAMKNGRLPTTPQGLDSIVCDPREVAIASSDWDSVADTPHGKAVLLTVGAAANLRVKVVQASAP